MLCYVQLQTYMVTRNNGAFTTAASKQWVAVAYGGPRPHSNYTTTTVSDPTSTENNNLKTTAAERKHSWTKAVETLIPHNNFYFKK